MKTAHAVVVTAGFALALLVARAPAAQEPGAVGGEGPPDWAYQMPHDLMSPYCPGRTLAACPSPQAAELRQWILFQAAAGRSQADHEAELYERFGDDILSAPKAKGWGFWAYVVPAVGFLLGGGLVAFLIRGLAAKPAEDLPPPRVRAAAPRTRPSGPQLSDAELEAIVDEDLASL